MVRPDISVLLPIYREEDELIKKAIDSILNQTYENFELILLLDTGKTSVDFERIYALVSSYKDKRIKLVINENNMGLPNTLNKGIYLASGEFIARMDADDMSLPERFEVQIKFMRKMQKLSKEIPICFSEYAYIDDNDRIFYTRNINSVSEFYYFLFSGGGPVAHPTWFGMTGLFRKYLYRNVLYAEDYDFLLRITLGRENIGIIKFPLLLYRLTYRKNKISNNKILQNFISILLSKYAQDGKILGEESISSFISRIRDSSLIAFLSKIDSFAHHLENIAINNFKGTSYKIVRLFGLLVSPVRIYYLSRLFGLYFSYRLGIKRMPINFLEEKINLDFESKSKKLDCILGYVY